MDQEQFTTDLEGEGGEGRGRILLILKEQTPV
jgi:hypothetical protein